MDTAFICNGMLGKLCKLMRMCGIDTAYTNEGMRIVVTARLQHRVVLTKNTRLRKKDGVLFIQATDPVRQLGEVMSAYELKGTLQAFSRCLECNHPLERISKEAVKHQIPFYTYQHFNVFARCTGCKKIYWQGSHYTHMVRALANYFDNAENNE